MRCMVSVVVATWALLVTFAAGNIYGAYVPGHWDCTDGENITWPRCHFKNDAPSVVESVNYEIPPQAPARQVWEGKPRDWTQEQCDYATLLRNLGEIKAKCCPSSGSRRDMVVCSPDGRGWASPLLDTCAPVVDAVYNMDPHWHSPDIHAQHLLRDHILGGRPCGAFSPARAIDRFGADSLPGRWATRLIQGT
jgi:hypothetical protein